VKKFTHSEPRQSFKTVYHWRSPSTRSQTPKCSNNDGQLCNSQLKKLEGQLIGTTTAATWGRQPLRRLRTRRIERSTIAKWTTMTDPQSHHFQVTSLLEQKIGRNSDKLTWHNVHVLNCSCKPTKTKTTRSELPWTKVNCTNSDWTLTSRLSARSQETDRGKAGPTTNPPTNLSCRKKHGVRISLSLVRIRSGSDQRLPSQKTSSLILHSNDDS